MKSDFLIAITQLSAEKKLPKEVIMEAVESALVSAYKKENPAVMEVPVSVKLHPGTGEFKVFVEKAVAEQVTDPLKEISLADARKLKKDASAGEVVPVEVVVPKSAGRIAAQTAKQVVLQRLREAERDAIYEEYATKQDDVVSGIIQRIESNKNIFMELGRTEALMPPSEQVRGERYRVGQRVRAYVLEVARSGRGPQVVVSRTHPNLLKRLFELEVPEAHNGTVEIKSIAREPGQRSKVAVAARQHGIDPVGSCVGQRGIRIQNIVSELGGEKIDVVLWDPNVSTFIANSLSPAQVVQVEVNPAGQKTATVVVPDRQLSLAIGKEGQNARLAAKLTGWKIDIKSASSLEEERAKRIAPAPAEKVPVAVAAMPEPAAARPELAPVAPSEIEIPAYPEPAPVMPHVEETRVPVTPVTFAPPPAPAEPKSIRFAEEILAPQAVQGEEPKVKKAKKKTKRERDEEAVARKGRRIEFYPGEDEE